MSSIALSVRPATTTQRVEGVRSDAETVAFSADRPEALRAPSQPPTGRRAASTTGNPDEERTVGLEPDALANATAEELQRGKAASAPIVVRPARAEPPYWFTPLQQWEGKVLTVEPDQFSALVHDLTSTENPPEEVVLARGDVSEGDLPLLVPGAIFYWTIGRKRLLHGQIERTSVIRFQRLPAWSQSTLEAVRNEARRMRALLGVHE